MHFHPFPSEPTVPLEMPLETLWLQDHAISLLVFHIASGSLEQQQKQVPWQCRRVERLTNEKLKCITQVIGIDINPMLQRDEVPANLYLQVDDLNSR